MNENSINYIVDEKQEWNRLQAIAGDAPEKLNFKLDLDILGVTQVQADALVDFITDYIGRLRGRTYGGLVQTDPEVGRGQ